MKDMSPQEMALDAELSETQLQLEQAQRENADLRRQVESMERYATAHLQDVTQALRERNFATDRWNEARKVGK